MEPIKFELEILNVEERHLKICLRCLVHTVLFHRVLSKTEPEEVFEEFLGVTYVKCGFLSENVDKQIDDFVRKLKEDRPSVPIRFMVAFFEKKVVPGFWSQSEEISPTPWETWLFTIQLIHEWRNPRGNLFLSIKCAM
eukprot:TRINITY_DN4325_c0_g1_i2.p1 TRINITY_DN4325_c0_g1~~TRINITY_DN4325_c0_g1_i2.p1  ORF type:complete len:138 (+),score=20.08 TRINITY_DN4325_c0_g1_i2:82-495(+)